MLSGLNVNLLQNLFSLFLSYISFAEKIKSFVSIRKLETFRKKKITCIILSSYFFIFLRKFSVLKTREKLC